MKTIYYFYDQILNAEKIPDNEISLLHGLLQAYLPKISKYFPRHVSGLFTTVCEHTDVAKTLLKQKDIQAVIDIINEKFKQASDIKDEYFRSLLEVFLSNYPQYIALIPVARTLPLFSSNFFKRVQDLCDSLIKAIPSSSACNEEMFNYLAAASLYLSFTWKRKAISALKDFVDRISMKAAIIRDDNGELSKIIQTRDDSPRNYPGVRTAVSKMMKDINEEQIDILLDNELKLSDGKDLGQDNAIAYLLVDIVDYLSPQQRAKLFSHIETYLAADASIATFEERFDSVACIIAALASHEKKSDKKDVELQKKLRSLIEKSFKKIIDSKAPVYQLKNTWNQLDNLLCLFDEEAPLFHLISEYLYSFTIESMQIWNKLISSSLENIDIDHLFEKNKPELMNHLFIFSLIRQLIHVFPKSRSKLLDKLLDIFLNAMLQKPEQYPVVLINEVVQTLGCLHHIIEINGCGSKVGKALCNLNNSKRKNYNEYDRDVILQALANLISALPDESRKEIVDLIKQSKSMERFVILGSIVADEVMAKLVNDYLLQQYAILDSKITNQACATLKKRGYKLGKNELAAEIDALADDWSKDHHWPFIHKRALRIASFGDQQFLQNPEIAGKMKRFAERMVKGFENDPSVNFILTGLLVNWLPSSIIPKLTLLSLKAIQETWEIKGKSKLRQDLDILEKILARADKDSQPLLRNYAASIIFSKLNKQGRWADHLPAECMLMLENIRIGIMSCASLPEIKPAVAEEKEVKPTSERKMTVTG